MEVEMIAEEGESPNPIIFTVQADEDDLLRAIEFIKNSYNVIKTVIRPVYVPKCYDDKSYKHLSEEVVLTNK